MFFDQLLQSISTSRFFPKAHNLVHQASERVFQNLDSDQLHINPVSQTLTIHFRNQAIQGLAEARRRKIDCFGNLEEREITLEELQQLRAERAQKAQLKLQQLEEQRNRRLKELHENRQKSVRCNKPLFVRLQEHDIQLEQELLNDRKEKLEQIKNMRRPFRRNEFYEHVQKIEEFHNKRPKYQIKSFSPSFEKSQFYTMIQNERQQQLEQELLKQKLKFELQERRKKYGEEVMVKFKPRMSPRILDQQQTPKKKSLIILESEQGARKRPTKGYDQNTSYDVTSQETQLPRLRYLSEQKVNEWQKVAVNKKLSQRQKNEYIIQEAKKLESIAQKQEQLDRVRGTDSPTVDELLVSSIKAKLTVLEN